MLEERLERAPGLIAFAPDAAGSHEAVPFFLDALLESGSVLVPRGFSRGSAHAFPLEGGEHVIVALAPDTARHLLVSEIPSRASDFGELRYAAPAEARAALTRSAATIVRALNRLAVVARKLD